MENQLRDRRAFNVWADDLGSDPKTPRHGGLLGSAMIRPPPHAWMVRDSRTQQSIFSLLFEVVQITASVTARAANPCSAHSHSPLSIRSACRR